MKKRFLTAAACLLSAAALTACVPTEATKVEVDPYFGETRDIKLDFKEMYNDVVEAFGGEEENPYMYITDLKMKGDNELHTIDIVAYCYDDTSKAEAEQFAAAFLRRANDAAAGQSNQYEMSDRKSFGHLWDIYSMTFKVVPESSRETDENPVLDLMVERGTGIPLNPDIETYEDEWREQRELIQENMVYDINGNVVFY